MWSSTNSKTTFSLHDIANNVDVFQRNKILSHCSCMPKAMVIVPFDFYYAKVFDADHIAPRQWTTIKDSGPDNQNLTAVWTTINTALLAKYNKGLKGILSPDLIWAGVTGYMQMRGFFLTKRGHYVHNCAGYATDHDSSNTVQIPPVGDDIIEPCRHFHEE